MAGKIAPTTMPPALTNGRQEVSRAQRAGATSNGRGRANIFVGGLFAIVSIAALAFVLQDAAREVPSVPQTTDPNWDVVGTIMLAPSGAFCRQLALDNNTGVISPLGFVRCINSEPRRTHAAEMGTAGRLESIRQSFAKQ